MDIEGRYPGISSLRGYGMSAKGVDELVEELCEPGEIVLSSLRVIYGGTAHLGNGVADGISNMITQRTGVLAMTSSALHFYAPGNRVMRRDPIQRTWPLGTKVNYVPGYGGGEKCAEFVIAGTGLVSDSISNKLPERLWDVIRLVQSREVAPAAESSAEGAADLVDRLADLASLHQSGVLTSEEFTAAKARLIHGA